MAESIGDLIVNMGADSTQFDEQIAWAKKQFGQLGKSEEKMARQNAVAMQKLIEDIDPAIRQTSRLDKQYAQLVDHLSAGRLSKSQFAHFSSMLDEARSGMNGLTKSTHEFSLQSGAARREMGVLIGELARGNFGALRRSGITLANRSGLIDQMLSLKGLAITSTIGAIAAGVYTMSKAWYDGETTISDFNKQLILTGNQAGLTADKMLRISRVASKTNGDFGAARKALTALVGAGVTADARFEQMTRTVAEFSAISGVSVDKVAEAFGKLTADPVSGLIAMEKQFHNVTAAQIDHVASLQRDGDMTRALQAANEAATSGFDRQKQRLLEDMGAIEKTANILKNAFKSMWDAAMDVGRPDSSDVVLKKAQAAFDHADEIWNLRKGDHFVNDEARDRYWNDREEARKALDTAKQKAAAAQLEAKNAKTEGAAEADRLKYSEQARANYEASITPLQKYTERQKELNAALKQGHILQADYNINMQAARREYARSLHKSKKLDAGTHLSDTESARTQELQTQLDVLKRHKDINDTISQQRKELWVLDSKIQILEQASLKRPLSKEEQSILATKNQALAQARVNAELGDQIVHQERLNKLADSMNNKSAELKAQIAKITQNQAMSTQEQQRQAELAQLKLDFEKQGGDIDDRKSFATQEYLRNLDLINEKYHAITLAQEDWAAGAAHSLRDWCDNASNLSQEAGQAMTQSLNGAVTGITDTLNGNKSSWRSWSVMILKEIEKIIVQLTLARMIKSALDGMAGSPIGWVAKMGTSLGGGAAVAGAGSLAVATQGMSFGAPAVPAMKALQSARNSVVSSSVNRRSERAMSSVTGTVRPVTLAPVFHFEVQSDPGTGTGLTAQSAKALGNFVENKILDVLHRNMRAGGMLAGGQG